VLDNRLQVGSYLAFFAVDLEPNGSLSLPYVWNYDVVDITVR